MATDEDKLIRDCKVLIEAYKKGLLGNSELPEDITPLFAEDEQEAKLVYFTLPMALNYRRNSTQLWKAARASYEDSQTRPIFSLATSAELSLEELQPHLLKYKLAMQPTRHTLSWHVIAQTLQNNWGSIEHFLEDMNYDYVKLCEAMQHKHKKGFPYLSGPKLFNYWCFILGLKCDVELKNKNLIDIAVDSHVLKCSIKLGVIDEAQAGKLSGEQIATIWRDTLKDSEIAPTDLNVPLWFWSRNGFLFDVER